MRGPWGVWSVNGLKELLGQRRLAGPPNVLQPRSPQLNQPSFPFLRARINSRGYTWQMLYGLTASAFAGHAIAQRERSHNARYLRPFPFSTHHYPLTLAPQSSILQWAPISAMIIIPVPMSLAQQSRMAATKRHSRPWSGYTNRTWHAAEGSPSIFHISNIRLSVSYTRHLPIVYEVPQG